MTDAEIMSRALELASRARGDTAPNPVVGAVVVADDEVVGEGWHSAAGEPHAEVVAIEAAGDRAAGATIYVTLEPCSHHGRTPPCVDAIIDAGIGRVVVAQEDPDPRVGGEGLSLLQSAGIAVSQGVMADAAQHQLRAYRHQRVTGRPFVVLKLAVTVDGAVAAPDGTSQWITSEAARADAHELRRESDAIVVGSGTVLADNPRLTVRTQPAPRRQPVRVVLDRSMRVQADSAILNTDGETLVWTGDLEALIAELANREALQVLVEGGPTVAGSFLRAGLFDRLVVYVGATLAGGDDAFGAFAGPAFASIDDFMRLELEALHRIGDDLRLDYRQRL